MTHLEKKKNQSNRREISNKRVFLLFMLLIVAGMLLIVSMILLVPTLGKALATTYYESQRPPNHFGFSPPDGCRIISANQMSSGQSTRARTGTYSIYIICD